MENLTRISDYVHHFYHPTYTRIPPYIIGILLGYLLHTTKNCGMIQINKVFLIKFLPWTLTNLIILKYFLTTGWTISTLLALAALFGLTPYLGLDNTRVLIPIVRVFYGAFHRSGFALSVAWVIFACTHKYGGLSYRI